VVRRGDSAEALTRLVGEVSAKAVYSNRCHEPAAMARDAEVASHLRAEGITVRTFDAALLLEPEKALNKQGAPFRVFTPFWRSCLERHEPKEPAGGPARIPAPKPWPASLPLDALELAPKVDWAAGIRAAWRPGAQGARAQLARFLDEGLAQYAQGRDRPDLAFTSRLSPHLHFGEIAPRAIWHAVRERSLLGGDAGLVRGAEAYLRQLAWREFAYSLLVHFPHTTDAPLRPDFARFPWQEDEAALRAWQRGRTGYPLVDAGMRELWTTGWMHNRVRMVAASFLVKHLLIPWQAGARWFWDTLVDADLANNTLGWQWTAGCGADAAPYFRIFNPVRQGQRFDPSGRYVRRWVPELAGVPDKWVHCPWQAPAAALKDAGIRLGQEYPHPIIDHTEARERALAAYDHLKGTRTV